jgi:chromosome segregation ATPase
MNTKFVRDQMEREIGLRQQAQSNAEAAKVERNVAHKKVSNLEATAAEIRTGLLADMKKREDIQAEKAAAEKRSRSLEEKAARELMDREVKLREQAQSNADAAKEERNTVRKHLSTLESDVAEKRARLLAEVKLREQIQAEKSAAENLWRSLKEKATTERAAQSGQIATEATRMEVGDRPSAEGGTHAVENAKSSEAATCGCCGEFR